ncbi:MAG: hypothetical protein SFZ23_02645 [Planctomycetota bacterium]|nr:hypothetical protein [Planctomycetota bacterium]
MEEAAMPFDPQEMGPGTAAERARQSLELRFGSQAWFKGAGIGRAGGADAVVVYVSTPGDRARLPASVDGVRVVAEIVGDVRAH